MMEIPGFKEIRCGTVSDHPDVGYVQLARPSKFNAFSGLMWQEFPAAVRAVEAIPSVRVVLVFAEGKHFCTGIDVEFLKTTFLPLVQSPVSKSDDNPQQQNNGGSSSHSSSAHQAPPPCPGLSREAMRRGILGMQDAFSALELCRWPVIVTVHGACIGGGIDLITACDVRICSSDATFCVKRVSWWCSFAVLTKNIATCRLPVLRNIHLNLVMEVDVAIAADLGTLQRLPTIVGHGAAMHLALTAQTLPASEALRLGLVSQVVDGSGAEAARTAGLALAVQIAAKPSLALMGTKRVLLHARDHSVADGLDYIATWNSAMLLSNELVELMTTRGRVKSSSKASPPASKL